MKDDRLYLHHMLERCLWITRFIRHVREAFLESEELASRDAAIGIAGATMPPGTLHSVLKQAGLKK